MMLAALALASSATLRSAPGGSRVVSASLANNVLVLDHLNLNHERGRHDLVRAFYFDVLGAAPDPRKAANLEKGRSTVWANLGIHQVHLSEGARAQVLDGVVSVAYDSLDDVRVRLASPPAVLSGTRFAWRESAPGELLVNDPWGTLFRLHEARDARDRRGRQPGPDSLPSAITDLCLTVPSDARLEGLARFYTEVLGCALAEQTADMVRLRTGSAGQTLTFKRQPPAADAPVHHEELRADEDGQPINDGVHVSLYVRNLRDAFSRAEELGCVFVNHRFSRRAYTVEEAVDQCMFRVLDVVDPADPAAGAIIRLEHEVRSALKADGQKYKSCPFDNVDEVIG